MRSEPNLRIEKWRVQWPGFESPYGASWGLLIVRRGTYDLRVLSSGTGDYDDMPDEARGWEHVSVSIEKSRNETPSWSDMAFVKDLFWRDDETVLQFHPKATEHVNYHAGCLHLWKKVGVDHELPPAILVGPKEAAT